MRAVVQRVTRARVSVDDTVRGSIEAGFLVLLGIGEGDDDALARSMAAKVIGLRVFEDDDGRMNRSLLDVSGAVLCISQFTLYGDVRRGNRPSFTAAAPPEQALPLYEAFCEAIEAAGIRCERGIFGAHMAVELLNDGPVTLVLDSDDLARPRR